MPKTKVKPRLKPKTKSNKATNSVLKVKKSKSNSSTLNQEFKKCPACLKEEGFNILIDPLKEKTKFVVRFRCRKCDKVFQIGLISDKKAKK